MTNGGRDDLLDHDYDGIQEYDNPLPGWWVGLFWATILFSAVYPLWYHTAEGRTMYDEYDESGLENMALQAKKYEHLAITDEAIVEFTKDAQSMKATAAMFQKRCASCHREDAGGNIGPNLTDPFWLHGSKPMEIYKTISEGVPAKGMQSWKKVLSPPLIMCLAAYVETLQGSNPPNPKAPEGNKANP